RPEDHPMNEFTAKRYVAKASLEALIFRLDSRVLVHVIAACTDDLRNVVLGSVSSKNREEALGELEMLRSSLRKADIHAAMQLVAHGLVGKALYANDLNKLSRERPADFFMLKHESRGFVPFDPFER